MRRYNTPIKANTPIKSVSDLYDRSVCKLKHIDLSKGTYVIAYQHGYTDKDDNTYRECHRFTQLQTSIQYIDAFKLINASQKRVSLEVLTDLITKGYFDIDAKNTNITKQTITDFINHLCNIIFIMCNTQLTPNDFIVLSRTKEEPYTSLHIVIKVAISKKDMHLITNLLKYNGKTEICKCVDLKVHSSNQQFSAIDNTKLKYYNETTTDTVFKPFDYLGNPIVLDKIEDGLVRIVDNLPHIKINNKSKLVAVMSKVLNKHEDTPITLKDVFTSWKRASNKQPKITYHLDDLTTTLYEYLCDNLPKSFYNNADDWKICVKMFKKKGMTVDEFMTFNINSVKDTKWSLEDNTKYFNYELHQNHLKPNIKLFIKMIHSYLPNLIIQYTNGYGIYAWIMQVLNIPTEDQKKYEYLIEDLEPNSEDTFEIFEINNKTYTFDTKSGNLYTTNKYDIEYIVGSYLFDVKLHRFSNTMEVSPTKLRHSPKIIHMNTLNEITPIITDFVNSNGMILGIKSAWGSGKTSKCIMEIVTQTENQVIVVSENNAYNSNVNNTLNSGVIKDGVVIYKGFIRTSKQFTSHINKKEFEIAVANGGNLVCSEESLHKIHITPNTIIIFDEYESLLNHFSSMKTFKDKSISVECFFNMIRISNRIMCLDADLSLARMEITYDLHPSLPKTIVYSKYNSFIDYKLKIFKSTETLTPFTIKYIVDNPTKRIIIPTSSKQFGIDLTSKLYYKFKNTHNVLIISSTVCKIYYKTTDVRWFADADGMAYDGIAINKDEFLSNINEYIVKYQVDIFIFTPTIKTGVSIDIEYFNVCIAYAISQSLCAREFIQSLFRSRNLIDKEIYIQTEHGVDFNKMKNYLSYNTIYKYINLPIQLQKSLTIYQGQDQTYLKYLDKIDSDVSSPTDLVITHNPYALIQLINQYEYLNSKKHLTQDILMRLVITHRIPVEIYEPNFEKVKDDEDDTIEHTTPFKRYNLLTHREYEWYKSQDRISSIPHEQFRIYELIYKQFLFNNISNKIIPYCTEYNCDINDIEEEDDHPTNNNKTAQLRMRNRRPQKIEYNYTEYDSNTIHQINTHEEYFDDDRPIVNLNILHKSYIPHFFRYDYIPIQTNKPLSLYKHTYYPKYKYSTIGILDDIPTEYGERDVDKHKFNCYYKLENNPTIIYKNTPQKDGDMPIILTDYFNASTQINYSNVENIHNFKTDDMKLYTQHINLNYNNRLYDLLAVSPHTVFVEPSGTVDIISSNYKNISFKLLDHTFQSHTIDAFTYGITKSAIKLTDTARKNGKNMAFLYCIQILNLDMNALPISYKYYNFYELLDALLYINKTDVNLEFITHMNSYLELFTIELPKPKKYKTAKSYQSTKNYINAFAPTNKQLRNELITAFNTILEVGGIELKTNNIHNNKRNSDMIEINYIHFECDNRYSFILKKEPNRHIHTEPIIVVNAPNVFVKCIQKNKYQYTYADDNGNAINIILYPSFNKDKQITHYKSYKSKPIEIKIDKKIYIPIEYDTTFNYMMPFKVDINPIVCNSTRFITEILKLQPNQATEQLIVSLTKDKCKCKHKVPHNLNSNINNYCMMCGGVL